MIKLEIILVVVHPQVLELGETGNRMEGIDEVQD